MAPLKASRISKQYLGGTFTALDDVSFELAENQITAFLGPSGCGKTTMLRIIAGLEYPTRGTLEVFGKDVKGPRSRSRHDLSSLYLVPLAERLEERRIRHEDPRRFRQPNGARERCSFLKLVHLEKFANSSSREHVGRHEAARRVGAHARAKPDHPS